jgi:signal transduction histidine kinase
VAILEIDDDGIGVDPDAVGDGMGLTNLRQRVSALGGDLSIVGAPGVGTTLRLTIPV